MSLVPYENFSAWTPWIDRALVPSKSGAGVYLLARFDDGAPTSVDTCDKRIVLVAETHDQTLEARWKQFHYSAFKGGSGHAGGFRFYGLFNNGDDTSVPSWLYLSVASIAGPDVGSDAKKLKNQLLDEYLRFHGVLPSCNARNRVGIPTSRPAEEISAAPSRLVQTSNEIEPEVLFTQWIRWTERAKVDGMEYAGVYVLACFDGEPPSSVDLQDERIVYIGETCDNDLAGRLYQFNRSAFEAKSGHSGGWSFASRCEGQGCNLYLSAFSVSSLDEPLHSAFIRHTERRLIWNFVKRWGRRPICNSK